ncbi:MAG: hypothetical protein JSW58_02365 [Candidatus Latescibacterota bacterium]|nr:MAG: hypothetical protein JSW58_02365 [Candidatus Latescibacterota bacterium]
MAVETDSIKPNDKERQPDADVRLVKAVSAGSVTAWHEFIDRYSGMIYGVVRRHLLAEDDDEVRSVFVDVLKSLHNGEIAKYRGGAALSTWLIVYSRSRALDFFRRRYGRYRTPEGYKRLSELDKKVLQLYYVQRLPLEIVLHLLDWSGFSAGIDDIVESVQRIEDTMDRRYLNRIERQHQADKFGMDSVRMLKYLIQLRSDYEEKTRCDRPDVHMIEREAKAVVDKTRELVSALSPSEKEIITLRFDRGWTAKKIAEKLDLGGPRRAYTLIDRVIRKLRRSLFPEGDL